MKKKLTKRRAIKRIPELQNTIEKTEYTDEYNQHKKLTLRILKAIDVTAYCPWARGRAVIKYSKVRNRFCLAFESHIDTTHFSRYFFLKEINLTSLKSMFVSTGLWTPLLLEWGIKEDTLATIVVKNAPHN